MVDNCPGFTATSRSGGGASTGRWLHDAVRRLKPRHNSHLYGNLPVDFVGDFAPVGIVAAFLNILVVHPSVRAGSVPELLALARQRKGRLAFEFSGVGSSRHLLGRR